MADQFVIALDEERVIAEALNRAILSIDNPKELMQAIGARLEANINRRFETKTAPDGTPWLPLAKSTLAAYAKKDKGSQRGSLLERSGDMLKSLASNADEVSVEVGFSEVRAAYHETGTWRGLPRRQMLSDDPVKGTLGAGDRQDVLDEIEAFLQSSLGA